MYKRILLPTDGSASAQAATDAAFDLAVEHDARLYLLFVVDTALYGEPALSSIELLVDELEEKGTELLSEVTERARERGIDVRTTVKHGVPRETIPEYGNEIDADVIVMGYQGETHRTKIGSVVDHVIKHTDRQVLVI